MRKGIVWNALAALGLSLAAATASADDFRGFYAGVGLGSNALDIDGGIDDSDTGFKAFAGYSLGEFVAIELAYMDGGKLEDSLDFGGGLLLRQQTELTTINLSVVGNLQLTERFALIGRLGYASIDDDTDVTLFDSGDPIFNVSGGESEEEISYGAGAVYTIGETVQLRAEYEGFDIPSGTLSFISFSALFRFRL